MTAAEKVVGRLRSLGFQVQDERVDFFGESLPLLKAVAVDPRAHQLVLVAEGGRGDADAVGDDDRRGPWRELLFAVSGLRHQLRGSGAPALGSPVLLAVVEESEAELVRDLVEEIVEEYALFSRIDINIVAAEAVEGSGGGAELNLALAPLLPRVRQALDRGVTVASQDIEQFWEQLGAEIREAADALARDFGATAAETAADQTIAALHPDELDIPTARPGRPVLRLELENFRSFEHTAFELQPVTIIHGVNGSGKTSICEALEILWAERTQRIPEDIEPPEYEKHLKRDGKPFLLRCDFKRDRDGGAIETHEARTIESHAVLPLGRTVLAQHVLTAMASGTPRERFKAFLDASGLNLPELDKQADQMRRDACDEVNEVLSQAGIDAIPAVNRNGLDHLRRILKGNFAAALPSAEQLEGAAENLNRATDGAYAPKRLADSKLPQLLAAVDSTLYRVHLDLDEAPDPTPSIDEAVEALRAAASRLRSLADPLRLLTQQLNREVPRPPRPGGRPSSKPLRVLSPAIAARWLSHVSGLRRSVAELSDLTAGLEDPYWRRRLTEYTGFLEKAIHAAPVDDLEELAIEQEPPSREVGASLDPKLLKAAGFVRSPRPSQAILAAMEEMETQLAEQAAQLDALSSNLERHPARSFVSRAARIMPALCRFELARELTKPRGALARARETLVTELMDDRLFPVVRELVAALVRFEWYFRPLQMKVDSDRLLLSGGANSDPELDIRMLLNAAERTVVGIAWFLALHILQPREERRVLALDDPASGFDSMNKAAFVDTLRVVVRLLEPEQLLITTHDDSLTALLEQELATVGDWPTGIGLLRCRRIDSTLSGVETLEDRPAAHMKADRDAELRKLSLEPGESPTPV